MHHRPPMDRAPQKRAVTGRTTARPGDDSANIVDDETNKPKAEESKDDPEETITRRLREKKEEGNVEVDLDRYAKFRKAAKQGKWQDIKTQILDKISDDHLTAPITEFYETLLHLLVNCKGALWLVKEIVEKIDTTSLGKTDYRGNTALSVAASVGNAEAAEMIAQKNPGLLLEPNHSNETPFHLAAKLTHDHTFKLILAVAESEKKLTNDIDTNLFCSSSGVSIVENLLDANHYGLTVELLNKYRKLGRDGPEERGKILQKLAQKPLAFKSGRYSRTKEGNLAWSDQTNNDHDDDLTCNIDIPDNRDEGHHQNPTDKDNNLSNKQRQKDLSWMFQKLVPSSVRAIDASNMRNSEAHQVVRLMCSGVRWTFEDARKAFKEAAFTAATLGVVEIVEEILTVYPAATMFYNHEKYNILDVAVINCRYMVFDLLYTKWPSILEKVLSYPVSNNLKNNLLHLAGSCIPSRHINGAALQMQFEMQWFMAVESVVPPSFTEQRNNDNKTPIEVFEEEHKGLGKDAEKWMRVTASSCMVVDALIIAMVFAAIIAVPGNVDDNGVPNFRKETVFKVFVVSNTSALFFSAFSLLLFVRLLTARYGVRHFAKDLPEKLLWGTVTLILSLAATLVASSCALFMLIDAVPGPKLVITNSTLIPIIVMAALPIIYFIKSQSRLLIEFLMVTYRSPLPSKKKKIIKQFHF
ncbi:hypothetical protein CCACVL1_06840 [Corchorus capsularis]|uniref:PGG domain-containing protein n=1 Tax=Corchorus capsularis TaxID=210143 RepID=A0A1R3JCC4_COCAP|nr:hypothetical protein CCACVL1_06840 [Corchorus capsularis]